MAKSSAGTKKVTKAKERVTKVFNQAKEQAKESFKVLETLEKEAVAKARNIVKIPIDRKRLTNDKILASLRKLGVATQDEVNSLRMRIEKLEAQSATRTSTESQNAVPRS